MRNRIAINTAAIATTVAAGWWLYACLHPHPPGIDRRPHEAAGERLAAEAVKLLEPGARLIVIARDSQPYCVPAGEAQLDGFRRTLKKCGRSISVTRTYKLDPLRVVGVPPGDFYDLLRQCGDQDIVVSFLGPPLLEREQLAKLRTKRSRILALCSSATLTEADLKRVFDQKLLAGAVVCRNDAPARAVAAGGQSAFDQMFKWITPDNLAELQPPVVAGN